MVPRQHLAIALPEGPLLKDNIARAQWAEEAGYDDLWLADGTGPDGLTLAAVLACHTKRIRIGMAVTPAFTRPPALLAATISVLDQVLPNRFAMGLGSSSEVIVSGWNGLPFEKPLSRVRDMLIVTRSMLEGEKAYLRNVRRIGLDLEPLAAQKNFFFLELPAPTPEGLPILWEQIAREIQEKQVERLVIDSFTAMAPAFQTVGDLRTFTHVLLGKIVGASGCTTLMITEEGRGGAYASNGVEEFVADGVIHFNLVAAGDARVRYIEITKMRGTNHQMGPIPIDIGPRGIRIVHPHVRGNIG